MDRVCKLLKQAACNRTPKEEGMADAADLPRSARGRHADADAPTATAATGLRLKLPAAAEASLTPRAGSLGSVSVLSICTYTELRLCAL